MSILDERRTVGTVAPASSKAASTWVSGLALGLLSALILWRLAVRIDRSSGDASLAVEPLRTVGTIPTGWSPYQFTDSLLAALGLRIDGPVEREVRDRTSTEFVLTGTIEIRHARLVITTALRRRRDPTVLWGATFWRDSAAAGSIIAEVADGVVAAMRETRSSSTPASTGGLR